MSDSSIEHRFSKAASTYDEVAEIQIQVARTLHAMLPPSIAPEHILEIGCGTGLMTRHLSSTYPEATIHALDISSTMIAQAQRRLNGAVGRWINADYAHFAPDTPYDLICSSSTLHWLTPLEDTIARIRTHLSANGILITSLMLHDTFKELHDLRNQLFPHKPVEQRLPTAEDAARALPPGYHLEVETRSSPITTPQSFFTALHKLGVTGGPVSRAPLSPGELKRLITAFKATQATWQIGYIRPARTTDHCA